jgi:hypothetical protein
VISLLQSQAKSQVEADAAAREIAATTPLDHSGRILAFIGGLFGIACLPIVFRMWVTMDIQGEQQKARDIKRFFGWGFAINLAASMTAIILFI